MKILSVKTGILKMDVASEGKIIQAGKHVIVKEVEDNFRGLSVEVQGALTTVRLPYYDTDIKALVD